jgi:hypothetical protein
MPKRKPEPMLDLILRGQASLDEKASERFEGRDAYLNASEAGTCIRKQWYQRNAKGKAAPQNWGYARRGSHGERYLVSAMREAVESTGDRFILAGDDQVTVRDEARKLSATPDGLILYADRGVVPEFKTIDPRTNRKNLPKDKHILQLQIGMALLAQEMPELPALSGRLIYMDASNYDDIVSFDVSFDENILKHAAKRASKLLRTKSAGPLDREGKANGGKECKTECPFKDHCGVDLAEDSTRKRANRNSNLDGAAVRFMELKDAEDEISVEKAVLAEEIKSGLIARGVNNVIVGDITVNLAVAKGRASLDKKAVAAAGIDLAPFTTVGSPTERLTVKRA